MSWIVRNLISDKYNIESNLRENESSYYIIDFENDTYSSLMAVEKKIEELYDKGNISDLEMEVITLTSLGKTYGEISKKLDISKPVVSKIFRNVCDRVAFSLGGEFTDEGFLANIIEKYNLNQEQIDIALNYMSRK